MRIITDGEYFAVAKGRWIFTRVLSNGGFWRFARSRDADLFESWTTIERAERRLSKLNRKWRDYHKE